MTTNDLQLSQQAKLIISGNAIKNNKCVELPLCSFNLPNHKRNTMQYTMAIQLTFHSATRLIPTIIHSMDH